MEESLFLRRGEVGRVSAERSALEGTIIHFVRAGV